MVAFRLILAVVLSLLVTLTGTHSVLQDRGPTHVVTLCTGYGATDVVLDAQGNPVEPQHHCPDCLAHVAVILTPPAALQRPEGTLVALVATVPQALDPRASQYAAQARSPPHSV